MLQLLFRRLKTFSSFTDPRILSRVSSFSSNPGAANDENVKSVDHAIRVYSSLSHWHEISHVGSYRIDAVDSDTWRVSTGLASASTKVGDYGAEESESLSYSAEEGGDQVADELVPVEGDQDFDDIEDMRVRGNLFYKIDRSSREFEEYKFDFHRRKSSSRKKDDDDASKKMESLNSHLHYSKGQKAETRKQDYGVSARKDRVNNPSMPFLDEDRLSRILKEKYIISASTSKDTEKRQRKPTFNQLTGPYHEPFCLDVLVSKGSVRACIVHRVTSKVVAVAHSISKDMKFDLGIGSPRNAAACAAVGKVLAQRALADDIHHVIFTPRKGDKLQGKLQIVLKSIVDNGVNVKVKLKQRNSEKVTGANTTGCSLLRPA
ncbi:hypothetical protein Dimus_027916 [Dionaea muscipula]